jgi:ABC-type uncharacterized transport system substrate-binding protein
MKEVRIAVMLSFNGIFHTSIAIELKNLIKQHSSSQISAAMINVGWNAETISRMTHDVMSQKYDLIVTIGAQCSKYVKKTLDEYGGHPMIFIGAADPVELGLVASLEEPGGFCSGVNRMAASHDAVISRLAPTLLFRKRLLLLYSDIAPNALALQKQVATIKKYVYAQKGSSITSVTIGSPSDALDVLEEHKGRFDTVLLLEGCPSEQSIDVISQWCWEEEVLLCASGYSALQHGAACTYGGNTMPYAEEAFSMIQQFCFSGIAPGTVPVQCIPDNRIFRVNTTVLQSIGLRAQEIAMVCDQDGIEVLRLWK